VRARAPRGGGGAANPAAARQQAHPPHTLDLTPTPFLRPSHSHQLDEYRAGKAPFPSVRLTPSFIIDFAGKEMAALAAKGPAAPAAPAAPPAAASQQQAEPVAAPPLAPASGQLDHVCLALADGVDMEAAAAELVAAGAPPMPQFDGTVVTRFGARGAARSVYVRTPEGATLELRSYPASAPGGE
jgi:catechol 2,3-dioxygenase-like lactoylglutathione lyase family enzyme